MVESQTSGCPSPPVPTGPFRVSLRLLVAVGWFTFGCGGGGATFRYAVGATDAIPDWQGPCDPATASADHVTFEGGALHARSPGTVQLSCAKGALVLEVRPVASVRIDGPDVLEGDRVFYEARALDASGRDLDLGNQPSVRWTLTGQVDRKDPCSHGHCARPSAVVVGRRGSGQAVLQVVVAGKRAEKHLTVR